MQLRVATLNAWALPGPFATDTRVRLESIAARLAELELDVVAFQEVWTDEARKLLKRAGREAGLHFKQSRAAIGESGLLTLSRFPFDTRQFDAFDIKGSPLRIDNGEYLSGKGIARLRLETDAGPVSIINTHLHAKYTKTAAHEYRAQRIAQIVQLAARIRDFEEPTIALGDFNFRESEPEHAVLTGLTGMGDAAADVDRREPTVYAANPYRLSRRSSDKRIDFAFYRSGTQHSIAPTHVERIFDELFDLPDHTATYSNHAGVLACFEMRPETSRPAVPDPAALELAREQLELGRVEAMERRKGRRSFAGMGLGLAAVAAAGGRHTPINRRRMLRWSFYGTAALALAPSVGASLLSEVFVPDEIRAFDDAAAHLAQLEQPLHSGDDELQLT